MITGKLITVEGPDGAGKTTVLEQLIPPVKTKSGSGYLDNKRAWRCCHFRTH
ncbi:thymidylate kinase [Streptococcus pyogenes]|nr:thymidylate kinase [Streptococcus pyogenes]